MEEVVNRIVTFLKINKPTIFLFVHTLVPAALRILLQKRLREFFFENGEEGENTKRMAVDTLFFVFVSNGVETQKYRYEFVVDTERICNLLLT